MLLIFILINDCFLEFRQYSIRAWLVDIEWDLNPTPLFQRSCILHCTNNPVTNDSLKILTTALTVGILDAIFR